MSSEGQVPNHTEEDYEDLHTPETRSSTTHADYFDQRTNEYEEYEECAPISKVTVGNTG